jgi:hypothetical protein
MSKLIRNTYSGWVSSNPILALGDTGFERDTGRSKIGDGVKAWNDLNYFNEASGGGGGRDPIDPVEFGDPVTAKLRYEILLEGGLSQVFFDAFTNNTLNDVARYPFGPRDYSIVAGELTSGATYILETAEKFTNGRVTIKGLTTNPLVPAIRPEANTNFLMAAVNGLYKVVGSTFTNLFPWAAPTAGDYNSLEVDGNLVTHTRWIGDPLNGGTVRDTFPYTLLGTDAAMFGVGVVKYGAVYGNGSVWKGDDLRVEKSGELRRLVADIDKPGGGVASTVIARS